MAKRKQSKISFLLAASMVAGMLTTGPLNVYAGQSNYNNLNGLVKNSISKLSPEELQSLNEAVQKGLQHTSLNEVAEDPELFSENAVDLPEIGENEDVRVIVELYDMPVVERISLSSDSKEELMKAATNQELIDAVLETQEATINEAYSIDPNMQLMNRYSTLINGFSIETTYGNIEQLKNLPNVKSVTLAERYIPTMNSAKNIAADIENLWTNMGYDGRGTVVSVIDTGIDWEHQDMVLSEGVDGRLTPDYINSVKGTLIGKGGKYFTEKIPFGFNYTADNKATVYPGNDEQEIKHKNGSSPHGSHVAGIVGANAQDPDKIAINKGIKGVAPESQLLAMKVFTNDPTDPYAYSDDVIAAIEDSIKLGADVINMSLGSPAGFQSSEATPHTQAIRKAVEHGVMVVVSAGNESYSTDPKMMDYIKDTAVVGSPGLVKETLQVASYENTNVTTEALTYIVNGASKNVPMQPTQSTTKAKMKAMEGKEVVWVGLGGAADYTGKDLTGKVALVERGTHDFATKQLNAQNAGAVGIIVYNNAGGGEAMINMAETPGLRIPAVFIGNIGGNEIKNGIEGARVEFNGNYVNVPNLNKGKMSAFTSWGPTPNLDFKPEITGVGGNIWSTVGDGGYANMSGTSMSSPYVAGFMAIYMQATKDLNLQFHTPEERIRFIKANAINTAEVIKEKTPTNPSIEVPVSPRRQGAGMVNVEGMIDNKVTATYNGEATMALKEIGNRTLMPIKLTNYGTDTVYYVPELLNNAVYSQQEIAKEYQGMMFNLPIEGASVTFDYEPTYIDVTTGSAITVITKEQYDQAEDKTNLRKAIQVTTGSSITVEATLDVPTNTKTDKYVEGFIRFNPIESEANNAVEIGIPFMGFYGEWDKLPIIDALRHKPESYYKMTSLLYESEKPGSFYFFGNNPDIYAINPDLKSGPNHVVAAYSLIRNAREFNISIEDANGNKIKDIYQDEYLRKEYTNKKTKYTLSYASKWNGTDASGNVLPDGQYYYVLRSKIDYPGADWQDLKIPVKIDRQTPSTQIKNIFNKVETNTVKVNFTAQDNVALSGFAVIIKDLATGNASFVKDANGAPVIYDAGKAYDAATGTFNLDVNLPYKKNQIAIVPIDGVGNIGMDKAGSTVVINTKAAQEDKLEIVSPKENAQIGQNQNVVIEANYKGTEKVKYEVEYTVDGVTSTIVESDTNTIDLGKLPIGSYSVIVFAKNEAGNIVDANAIQINVGESDNIVITNLTQATSFKNGDQAKIIVSAKNNTDQNKNVSLIVALFDDKGRMINIVAVDQLLNSTQEVKLNAMMNIPKEGKYVLKAFVWDSLEGANPLSNVVIYPVAE